MQMTFLCFTFQVFFLCGSSTRKEIRSIEKIKRIFETVFQLGFEILLDYTEVQVKVKTIEEIWSILLNNTRLIASTSIVCCWI